MFCGIRVVFTFFSTIIVSSNYFFFQGWKEGGGPCPDCVYVSKHHKKDAEEHFQNCHSNRTENRPCIECDKVFVTSWHMKVHFQEEHDRYKCDVSFTQHLSGVVKEFEFFQSIEIFDYFMFFWRLIVRSISKFGLQSFRQRIIF